MKKVSTNEQAVRAQELLSEIEGLGMKVKSSVKAGNTGKCVPGSCPVPMYGTGLPTW